MPMEWKVPSQGMPSTAPPTIWPTRSFISRAALFVKVTARISFGRARPRPTGGCAIRVVSTRVLPVPAPARTSTGPSRRLHGPRAALYSDLSDKALQARGHSLRRPSRRCSDLLPCTRYSTPRRPAKKRSAPFHSQGQHAYDSCATVGKAFTVFRIAIASIILTFSSECRKVGPGI